MPTPEDDNPQPVTLTIAQLRERAEHTQDPHVRGVYQRALAKREEVARLAAAADDPESPHRLKLRHDAEVQARVAALAEETRLKLEEEGHARAVAERERDQEWLASLTPVEREAVRQHRVAIARAELEANDPAARTRRDKAAIAASVRI